MQPSDKQPGTVRDQNDDQIKSLASESFGSEAQQNSSRSSTSNSIDLRDIDPKYAAIAIEACLLLRQATGQNWQIHGPSRVSCYAASSPFMLEASPRNRPELSLSIPPIIYKIWGDGACTGARDWTVYISGWDWYIGESNDLGILVNHPKILPVLKGEVSSDPYMQPIVPKYGAVTEQDKNGKKHISYTRIGDFADALVMEKQIARLFVAPRGITFIDTQENVHSCNEPAPAEQFDGLIERIIRRRGFVAQPGRVEVSSIDGFINIFLELPNDRSGDASYQEFINFIKYRGWFEVFKTNDSLSISYCWGSSHHQQRYRVITELKSDWEKRLAELIERFPDVTVKDCSWLSQAL